MGILAVAGWRPSPTNTQMADETLRFAICEYIKNFAEQCEDEDMSESLEVAAQCLPEGFGIDFENPELSAKHKLPASLLEIFQAGLTALNQNQGASSHHERLQNDPKYVKFIGTLSDAGFFKGVEEGTPDYEARLTKAHDTYVAKYGNTPVSQAATAAAPTIPELSTAEKEAKAAGLKEQGNKALAAKNFDQAVDFYTQALALVENHIFRSNRAAALSYLNRHEEALEDAEVAIQNEPSYVKAYSRKGLALFQLGRYEEAVEVYEQGLGVDPSNASLQTGLQEAKQHLPSAAAPQGAPGAGGMADIMRMAQGLAQDPNAAQNIQNLLGGMGGQGGQGPDLGALLNNPMMQQMAQNMMQDPNMMQNMMNMMGGMGAGGMGGMPDAGDQQIEDEDTEEIN